MALELRPLGLGDLLDRGFRLYRERIVTWLGITAMALVPEAIIVSPLMPPQGALFGQRGHDQWEAIQRALILVPITFVALVLAQAALTVAIADRYLDRPFGVRIAYRGALERVATLIGVTLVSVVGLALPVGGGAMVGLVAGLPGMVLGLLVGFVVMVYLWLGWLMAPTVVVIEGGGVFASMRRSWRLAKGSRLRLFVLLLLFFLLGLAVEMTVSSGMGLFGGGDLVSALAERLARILVLPVTQAAWVLVYFDSRVRKEGFDLEVMAKALGPPVAPMAGPEGRG